MDYQDKLRLAKEALDSGSYDKETIEYIFPELKESEDERIRKALIQHIKDKVSVILGWRKEELINWLEKQGEQKTINKVKPKFKVGDIIKYVGEREEFSKEKHTIKKIFDDFYLTIDDTYIPFKFEEYYTLINQNQSWSEEDEMMLECVLDKISDLGTGEMCKDWLKSLKERYLPQ